MILKKIILCNKRTRFSINTSKRNI